MNKDIKVRLTQLGKKQVDLLEVIRKRGYPKLLSCTLSSYINGHVLGPQSEVVLTIAREILDEWEKADIKKAI